MNTMHHVYGFVFGLKTMRVQNNGYVSTSSSTQYNNHKKLGSAQVVQTNSHVFSAATGLYSESGRSAYYCIKSISISAY